MCHFFQTCLKMYLWPIFIFICLKKVKVQFAQLPLTVYDPMECTLLGSSVHGILQARILGWVAVSFSKGCFDPWSPALQADSLQSQPLGKLKNTRVGSLSLPKHMFPTQESNQGLLYCRRILYQLT